MGTVLAFRPLGGTTTCCVVKKEGLAGSQALGVQKLSFCFSRGMEDLGLTAQALGPLHSSFPRKSAFFIIKQG